MSDIPVGGAGVPLAQGHLEAHRLLSERVGAGGLFAELAVNLDLPGAALTNILTLDLPGPATWWIWAGVLFQATVAGAHDIDLFLGAAAGALAGPRAGSARVGPLVSQQVGVTIGPARVTVAGTSLVVPLQAFPLAEGVRALARTPVGSVPGCTAMVAR